MGPNSPAAKSANASPRTMKRSPGRELAPTNSVEDKRQRYNSLVAQLKSARTSFEGSWSDLARYFRPRRLRLQPQDRNKGDRRNQSIVDSTPVYAARTCSSGLMSGMTSPARVWFKMTVTDKKLLENAAVKNWLEDVRDGIARVLSRSNFYATLQTFYSDLAVFGTTCMLIEEDANKVIRCTHFAIGEYWLGYNETQQVRTFVREYELTVDQIVKQFGKPTKDGYATDNLSTRVVNAWEDGQTQQGFLVTHIITENSDYQPSRLHGKHKRFSSCYYESAGERDRFLDETGYDEWPIMAVRWETTTGDVYGTDCPGMTTIGDVKELMFAKKLAAGALNKAVNPPTVAPVSLRNTGISILPGTTNWVDEVGDKKIRPLFDTSGFRLDWALNHIEDLRNLIEKGFFVDLFLIIDRIEKANTTATEILEKKEEKLLSLGPIVENSNEGFLDPAMDRVFGIMFRRGMIPEPPQEMAAIGYDFHPEYESIMAQAQRAQGRSGIEAFAIFVTNAAKVDPSVLDEVNANELVKKYAEVTGVPPNFINPDEVVQAIRKARADAAAKQQAAEQAQMVADSANKLAKSPTDGKNALTDLLASNQPNNTLSGSPGPQGGY